MRVSLKQAYCSWPAGAEVDIADLEAQHLIKDGRAKQVVIPSEEDAAPVADAPPANKSVEAAKVKRKAIGSPA